MATSLEGSVRKLLKTLIGVEPKGSSVESMLEFAANNYTPKTVRVSGGTGIKSIVGTVDSKNVLHLTFTMSDGSSQEVTGRINVKPE